MTKQVKQLDRVIIRFAGDSGDGMQLTGDRFTQESAAFGNDLLDPAELPRRDPRPAGHAAGRLVVPGALRRPRHPHARRRARRAGGDEPGRAARPTCGDLHQGRDDHRRQPRLHRPQPDQGRLRRQPARGRLPRRVRRPRRRPDRDDRRGGQGVRPLPQGRRPGQEHVRARACCPGCTAGRPRPTIAFLEKRFAKVPDIRDANITAFKAGWNFGETTEAFAVPTRSSRRRWPPGTYRNITGNLALAYGLVAGSVQSGLPIFLGSYPITPASDILHELSKHKRVRRHDVPGRGRDRRHRRRARRLVRRRARRHHHLRPGHRAEVGDDRPRA